MNSAGKTIVGTILALTCVATTSRATCGFSSPFASYVGEVTSYVHTPGVCDSGAGCAPTSVSADVEGYFWRLGFGDPAPGAGIDNGTWSALDGWLLHLPGEPAYVLGDWAASSAIDGCIAGSPEPRCMAILFGDQRDGQGFFALLSQEDDGASRYSFLRGAGDRITLADVPRPRILGTSSLPGGAIAIDLLTDPVPDSALYLDEPVCATGAILGYRLYRRSGPPMSDRRREGWELVTGAAPIPLGETAQVVVDPECATFRFAFATSLVFDGGFETPFLSAEVAISDPGWIIDHDCDGWPGFSEAPEIPLDCDDSDPTVYPGAPQICDHQNNDCDHPSWPSLDGTNEAGPDMDDDGWADTCDLCPERFDPAQADRDGDGIGDRCDLDDGLIQLESATRAVFVWQQEVGVETWNIYRGSLAVLREGGPYTQAPGSNPLALRACGLPTPEFSDGAPAPDVAAFYLASGVGGGIEGDLGTDSAGAIRPNVHPCP